MRNILDIIHAPYIAPGNETTGDIKISLICPTRARPRRMAAMWHSAVATADDPGQIEVVFYIDEDDAAGKAGLALSAKIRAAQVSSIVGRRLILSECWNAAAKIAKGGILMHCGDDIIFRSQGWDAQVIEKIDAFPDRIAFVYGRDGINDKKLGTHGFISSQWMEATGYMVPPIFSSDYNDMWLNEVAGRIGRRIYVPQIYTEHMHFMVQKSAKDATYLERLKRHRKDKMDEIWSNTAHLREADAQKLRACINQNNTQT